MLKIKKCRKFIFSTAILLISFASILNSQDRDTYEVEDDGSASAKYKNIFLDVGYGGRGLSFGAGFRWWTFSAGIGLSGIVTDAPNVQHYSQNYGIPAPNIGSKDYQIEKFASTTVSLDLSYYYDYDLFSPFITVGYYVQSDSVFLKYTGEDYRYNGTYFQYAAENSTGFAWGIGCQYYPWESMNVALGYHNKKGIFAQIGYFWK